MSLQRLRAIEIEGPINAGEVFDLLFEAGSHLNDDDRASERTLEIVIRLLDAIKSGMAPADCSEAVQLLAEECGLYPYIELRDRALIDQVVSEAHRIELDRDIFLHAKQMEVLLSLLSGDNVILSGPTSFGKSLVLDAFISRAHPACVVAILPTLALIDETRRRIAKNFPWYKVITTVSEDYVASAPVFFALTQERFLQRKDIGRVELLFVDEFYKLDEGRDDSRFEILNLALYKGMPKSRQIFMAGPHIQGISLGKRWTGRFKFIATDYKTVAVNVYDRSGADDRDAAFVVDLKSVKDANSLIFAASPPSAYRIADLLRSSDISYSSDRSREVAQWLREHYHPAWQLADAVENGIGLHHGRVPRSLGQLFIKLFDAGILKVLICTSTLIEGVNTSAANVFIYDKKINTTDFDFFSFANIRGRVGRMMRHFVGNAYLYHEAPEEVSTDIEIPILSTENPKSEYLLVNVEDADLDEDGLNAKQVAISRTELPLDVLREHSYLGLDLLEELNEVIKAALKDGEQMMWSGFPDRDEMIAVAGITLLIAQRRRQSTGVHTKKQVAWAWGMLMQLATLSEFVDWFVKTFGEDSEDGIDRCFQFLQAAEFTFPRGLAICESIVNLQAGPGSANYRAFIYELEKWFRPHWMKTLDEMGVPLPLSEKYSDRVSTEASKREAIATMATLESEDGLRGFDRDLFQLAFYNDAVSLLDQPPNRR